MEPPLFPLFIRGYKRPGLAFIYRRLFSFNDYVIRAPESIASGRQHEQTVFLSFRCSSMCLVMVLYAILCISSVDTWKNVCVCTLHNMGIKTYSGSHPGFLCTPTCPMASTHPHQPSLSLQFLQACSLVLFASAYSHETCSPSCVHFHLNHRCQFRREWQVLLTLSKVLK